MDTVVNDQGTHFEIFPRELLPAGASLIVTRNGLARDPLAVTADRDDQPPPAPVVRQQRPDYECRPIVSFEIEEPDDATILLARVAKPPTKDQPADVAIVTYNDTLVLESEDGSDFTVFLVAMDLAGNRSDPTEVEVDFKNIAGCSSGNASTLTMAPILLAVLRNRKLHRKRGDH